MKLVYNMKRKKLVIILICVVIIALIASYIIYDWVIYKPISYFNKLEKYDNLKLDLEKTSLYTEVVFSSDDQELIQKIIQTIKQFKVRRTNEIYVGGTSSVRIYNDEIDLTISLLGNQIGFNSKLHERKQEEGNNKYAELMILDIIEEYKNKM